MQMVHIESIKPHTENDRIYGDTHHLPHSFVEDVRANGVQVPILITTMGVIVSGERRWRASEQAGKTTVPVQFLTEEQSNDPLYVLERLIKLNAEQRVRTDIQMVREAKALAKIEEERSKQRTKAGNAKGGKSSGATRRGETKSPAKSPETSSSTKGEGDTRRKVAKTLGIGEKKAGEAIAVGKAIDAAREAGDDETADAIEETVAKRNIHSAYVDLTKSKAEPPKTATGGPSLATIQVTMSIFKEVDDSLVKARAGLRRLASRNASELVKQEHDVDAALKAVRKAKPVALGCHRCQGVPDRHGSLCPVCFDHGWVSKETWDGLTQAEREQYPPPSPP